jgi:phosphatidylethanolamine/phosphatidyl-N-methylethanolamine N-methyltransferase
MSEFVSKPILTGSIVPSSAALAAELLRDLKSHPRLIVEVGPGTGAITHQLLDSPALHGRYFGLDINPVFVEKLRALFPEARFECGSAENLEDIMKKDGLGATDFVVSGLPWSLIKPHRQERILKNIYDVMEPGGEFVTFIYLHTPLLKFGRSFLKSLRNKFPSVTRSSMVWANVPPAVVYRCRKTES